MSRCVQIFLQTTTTIFSPLTGGCSEGGPDAFRFFFIILILNNNYYYLLTTFRNGSQNTNYGFHKKSRTHETSALISRCMRSYILDHSGGEGVELLCELAKQR